MAEKKKEKKALLHDTYLYNVQQGGRFTTMEIAQKGILEWNNSHKLFVLQIFFCKPTQIMTSFFLLQSLQQGNVISECQFIISTHEKGKINTLYNNRQRCTAAQMRQ